MLIRCGRESQQSGLLGLRLSSPGERERHNADGHKSGGQNIAVLFGLQLPLTHKRYNKMRGIYFVKEVFARLSSLLCCYDYEYTSLTDKKINVSNNCIGEYENMCEIEEKNVCSCINRNELILENFMC